MLQPSPDPRAISSVFVAELCFQVSFFPDYYAEENHGSSRDRHDGNPDPLRPDAHPNLQHSERKIYRVAGECERARSYNSFGGRERVRIDSMGEELEDAP